MTIQYHNWYEVGSQMCSNDVTITLSHFRLAYSTLTRNTEVLRTVYDTDYFDAIVLSD